MKGNVHWTVPRAANGLFVGRKELLKRIEHALLQNDSVSHTTTRRFVITGLGGLGKSEICLQFANQAREW